jgi:hypothetical protein
MEMVKAILTKPLDGFPEGAEREFEREDFERLVSLNAVRAADDVKAAPTVSNKAAPPVENKAADVTKKARRQR